MWHFILTWMTLIHRIVVWTFFYEKNSSILNSKTLPSLNKFIEILQTLPPLWKFLRTMNHFIHCLTLKLIYTCTYIPDSPTLKWHSPHFNPASVTLACKPGFWVRTPARQAQKNKHRRTPLMLASPELEEIFHWQLYQNHLPDYQSKKPFRKFNDLLISNYIHVHIGRIWHLKSNRQMKCFIMNTFIVGLICCRKF